MKVDELSVIILRNANIINEMTHKINQTYITRSVNPKAWKEACRVFRDSYDSLAFPGGLTRGLELLAQKDSEVINSAIAYLKVNPYCFRSGYVKQKIIHLLKQVELSETQKKQLRAIIINNLQSAYRFEYKPYARLALKITNPQFESQLEDIVNHSSDKRISRRAKGIIELLQK